MISNEETMIENMNKTEAYQKLLDNPINDQILGKIRRDAYRHEPTNPLRRKSMSLVVPVDNEGNEVFELSSDDEDGDLDD